MDSNNFLQIINRIRAITGKKYDYEVGDLIGIKKSNLSQRISRNSIPYDEIKKWCEDNNISLEYILYGKGDPPTPVGDHPPTVTYPSDSPVFMLAEGTSADDDFVLIPHVSGKISAGVGFVPENEVHVKVAFRKDWIRKKGQPEKMSLIKVKGDSMEPTLSSGDMILVDHGRNSIDPQGGIYAIVIDDMIMIKRLHVLGTNKIRIVSDNPHYEPIETTADELQINGKVLWFCRELER